jgi:hypothetical protein
VVGVMFKKLEHTESIMKSKYLYFTIFLLWFSSAFAEPMTNNEKAKMYCNAIIKPLTILSLRERNKGISKIKLISTLKSMEEFSRNQQLKADIEEIANFVYTEGRTTSDKKVISFIVNQWCIGQAHTFSYQ